MPDGVHEVIEELVLVHEVARAEAWRCNAEVLHSGLHGESGCVLFTQAWPHDTIIGRDGLPICDVFQISRDMVASWSKACDFRTFRGQWYRHWRILFEAGLLTRRSPDSTDNGKRLHASRLLFALS